MNDLVTPVTPADSDGHGSKIPVPNYHTNVVDIVREAARRFTEQTGKDGKFLYVPDAMLYLIDGAVKTRAKSAGVAIPVAPEGEAYIVSNLFGLELIPVPGTCITVTAEASHVVASETPALVQ